MPSTLFKSRTKQAKNNPSGVRRVFTLNIGTIVFGLLFIYILISILLYVTATHVRSFQVTAGPLARNAEYTGIAVYTEHVVSADASGYVDYYAGDHAKVKRGGVVYGISPVKNEASLTPVSDAATLKAIREDCEQFSQVFAPQNFHDIYSLKYMTEGEILNTRLAERHAGGISSTSLSYGDATISVASHDGIVCYSTDGCENLDYKSISPSAFDDKNYSMTALKTDRRVAAGDPLYRLIESEDWSLLIPLTAKQIVKMNNLSNVRVKFLKDGVTQNADFTILTMSDGTYYGKLDVNSGLIRYLDSRFIDIELVTNSEVGLKIPVSSIVSKQFFTIPEEYATYGGNKKNIGFLKATADRGGNASTTFVQPTIYNKADGRYYVDDSVFREGDIVIRDGSTDRFIIRDRAVLEGVYSMNKGFAVFRKIVILDKNEDYCIVEKGTPYGIAQFDNIVENASSVKDSQITAQ